MLAIIGVATGMTIIAAGAGDGSVAVRAEAMRLADRLELATDEVLVRRERIALALDEDGYAFLSWSDEAKTWAPCRSALLRARREARRGVAFSSLHGERLVIDPSRGAHAEIRVEGAGAAWRVTYDGLAARAEPVVEE